MKFDIEFEEEILSNSVQDIDYLKRSVRILNAHHFNTKYHSWFWKTVKDIWLDYKEQATPKLILSKLKKDIVNDDDREPYIELIKKIFRKESKIAKATLAELSDFVRAVNAQLTLEKAAKNLELGKLDDFYNNLQQAIKNDLKPSSNEHEIWIENFGKRQVKRKHLKENPDLLKVIPTGFHKLDSIMNGGIKLGDLGLIMATTKKGKSIALTNIGYNAVKCGFKVIYFALEMNVEQVTTRMDSRWLGIDYNKFKKYDFSKEEEKIIENRLRKVKEKYINKMHFVSVPIGNGDINVIIDELEDKKYNYGFEPDLILLDSADHLKSSRRMESFRIEQTQVYWDVKNLAMPNKYAIWSSTHARRDYAKKIAEAEAAGESYDKSRIADIIISLNTPDKKTRTTKIIDENDEGDNNEKDKSLLINNKKIQLFVAANRDGVSDVIIPLEANFAKMFLQESEEDEDY